MDIGSDRHLGLNVALALYLIVVKVERDSITNFTNFRVVAVAF